MSPLLLQKRASDDELLRRIRSGDPDAFTALHARYAPALERYAAETSPEDEADLVLRVDDPRHPALVEPAEG